MLSDEKKILPIFDSHGLLEFPFFIDADIYEMRLSGKLRDQDLILKLIQEKDSGSLYYEVRVRGLAYFYLAYASEQNIISDTYYKDNEKTLESIDEIFQKFAIEHHNDKKKLLDSISSDRLCYLEFTPTIGAHLICLCKNFDFFPPKISTGNARQSQVLTGTFLYVGKKPQFSNFK